MRARRCGLVLGTTAALVLSAAGGGASAAVFGDGAGTSASAFSATALLPVTSLSTSTWCENGLLGLLGKTPVIQATWTRSALLSSSSSPLRNHQVRLVLAGVTFDAVTRSAVTGDTSTTDVIGQATIPGGVQSGLAKDATYTVQVRSQWGQWLSAAVTSDRTTPSGLGCL